MAIDTPLAPCFILIGWKTFRRIFQNLLTEGGFDEIHGFDTLAEAEVVLPNITGPRDLVWLLCFPGIDLCDAQGALGDFANLGGLGRHTWKCIIESLRLEISASLKAKGVRHNYCYPFTAQRFRDLLRSEIGWSQIDEWRRWSESQTAQAAIGGGLES